MRTRLLLLAACLLIPLTLIAPVSAQRPRPPRYAERGPFAVGTRELVLAGPAPRLSVTIWYPALNPDNLEEKATYQYGPITGEGRALRDAAPDAANGPYPLIIFSHGLGGARLQFLAYTEHLASYGFVVMAADHPGSTFGDLLLGRRDSIVQSFASRPSEVLRQLAFAETLTAPGGDFAGAIDTNTVGVTGHSFGGYTTLSAGGARLDFRALRESCANGSENDDHCGLLESAAQIAALRGLTSEPEGLFPPTTDPRIRAVVPLAPSSGPLFGTEGAAALEIPLMIIVGSKDRATIPERDAYPVYEAVSSPKKALVVLDNAGHYIFVDACAPALLLLGRFAQCSDPVWDIQRAHDLITHFATAFFMGTLKGDAEALAALAPEKNEFVGVTYRRDGAWE